jgi:hypothetical protein
MSRRALPIPVVLPSENLVAPLLSKRGCALQARLYRQQYRALKTLRSPAVERSTPRSQPQKLDRVHI